MSTYYKAMAMTIILILFASCGEIEPAATPVPPTTAASPTNTPIGMLEGTPSAPPTSIPPTPEPELSDMPLSFVDSGQRLGTARSWDVALGDLDGDGDTDAFVTNGSAGDINNTVWLNDGGTFSAVAQRLGYGMGVALGDLDGDGDLDAFVVSWDDAGQVWLNDGSGMFSDSGQALGSAGGWKVALDDLDGDGDLDAFIAHTEANTVWFNDGNAAFTDSAQRLGQGITARIALDDLDQDGDTDALTAGWNEPAKVWFNDGAGIFTDSGQPLTPGHIHVHGMALGDVDGDGDTDAYLGGGSGYHEVWLNDGQGVFNESGQRLSSQAASGVALGDLDGDGDLDVFAAIEKQGHVNDKPAPAGTVWLNEGGAQGGTPGHFTDSGLPLSSEFSSDVALGDLDGDGDLDAFVAHGELGRSRGGGLPNEIWLNETVAMKTAATATPLPTATPSPVAPATPPAAVVSETPAGRIVFYSEREGNPDIYSMNPDGSDLQRLTHDPAYDDAPALSPDGTRIVFLTSRHDPEGVAPNFVYEIYIMDSDGQNQRRLTTTDAAENHPAWSPDGKRISFDADYDGDGYAEIYRMHVESMNVTRLTFNQANDQFADWSPGRPSSEGDGQIAFTSDRDGGYDIYVMDADGSNQRPLTSDAGWELFPAWSPDGTKIAYFACDVQCRPNRQDIYVMNADGSHKQQLTDRPRGVDEDPAWSPDGQYIAFQSNRDRNFEIYRMRLDGTEQTRLTHGGGGDYWPSWGPAATPALSASLTLEKSAQTFPSVPTWKIGLAGLDADGDDDLDLVLADYMEPCQIWLNEGSGQFMDSGIRFGQDQFCRHIHLGDLDGDSDLDIFLATFGMNEGPNEIWINE